MFFTAKSINRNINFNSGLLSHFYKHDTVYSKTEDKLKSCVYQA